VRRALYEIVSLRNFAGLKLNDETTILKLRHLLEEHRTGRRHPQGGQHALARKGLLLKRGSIVDATIIAVPSSTKNAEGAVRAVERVDGAPVLDGDDENSPSEGAVGCFKPASEGDRVRKTWSSHRLHAHSGLAQASCSDHP
jgi:IS5 family transposase